MLKAKTTYPLIISSILISLTACEQGVDDELLLDDEFDDSTVTAQTLAEDSKYMRELARQKGTDRFQIDLTDERQYAFLRHRMAYDGLNAVNSPGLFAVIESGRDGAADDFRAACNNGLCCGLVVLSNSDHPDGEFVHTGVTSCFNDSADYTYMQLCQYDENNVLLNCNGVQIPGNIVAPSVVTQSQAQFALAEGVVINSGDFGTQFDYITTSLLENTSIYQLDLSHPSNIDGNAGVTLWMERSPSPGNWDYRHTWNGTCGGNSICDNTDTPMFPVYDASATPGTEYNYNGDLLYMPIESNDTAMASRWIPGGATLNSAKMWMTLQSWGENTPPGGLCETDFTDSPFLELLPVGPPYFPYPIPNQYFLSIDKHAPDIGNGTWPEHCVDNRAAVDLHVQVEYATGGTKSLYTWSSIGKPGFDFLKIAWGCLPPGVQIAMADESERAIEDVRIGDEIIVDDEGHTLTVVEVQTGEEHEPLVAVEDSFGHELLMTSGHPVPTLSHGLLRAEDLEVGMRVETLDGDAEIIAVRDRDYDGEVFNLVLGTEDELAEFGGNTTMIANGWVVGDSRMQDQLRSKRDRDAESARASKPVSSEFAIDFLTYKLREFSSQVRD